MNGAPKLRPFWRACIVILNLVIAYYVANSAVETYNRAAQFGYLGLSFWKIGIAEHIAGLIILGALALAAIFARGRAVILVLCLESIAVFYFLCQGLAIWVGFALTSH